MLKKFHNVKYLKLKTEHRFKSNWAEIQSKFDDKLLNHFDKLQAICLETEPQFSDVLLHHVSHKLVLLHITSNIRAPMYRFKQLIELWVYNADYNKIYNVTKTAKDLKRLSLQFIANNISPQNEQRLEDVMVDLLNQSTLEFIGIFIDEDIEIVENALKRISMTKRDGMKVKMKITQEMDCALEYFNAFDDKLNEDCKEFAFEFECILT